MIDANGHTIRYMDDWLPHARCPKLTVPEAELWLRAYTRTRADGSRWARQMGGIVHIVVDDDNVSNAAAVWCLNEAIARGDVLDLAIASIVYKLSKTQRLKLNVDYGRPA